MQHSIAVWLGVYYISPIPSRLMLYCQLTIQIFEVSQAKSFCCSQESYALYVKAIVNLEIYYPIGNENEISSLFGFADSDYAGTKDATSTPGFICELNDRFFSQCSKKQNVATQSTAEAEHIAANYASNHCIWLRQLLLEIGFDQKHPTIIHMDNKAVIPISKNPVQFNKVNSNK